MVITYPSKKLSKCSKQDLILLIQGQEEAEKRLLKLLEEAYLESKNKYSTEKGAYLEGFVEGFEAAENIVEQFFIKED